MSRARRSLSSTASSSLSEESRSTHTVPIESSGNTQKTSTDLEDGEIADETNLKEAEAVNGRGEAADKRESYFKDGSRVDEVGHEQEDNVVPNLKPSTPDVETLKSLDGSEEHLQTDSSHPTSAAAPDPNPGVSVANTLFALSDEELEIAKDVVLDLLGWGVQPEYLIECGISSHAIYRIFTDLHLRLPTNLSYFGHG